LINPGSLPLEMTGTAGSDDLANGLPGTTGLTLGKTGVINADSSDPITIFDQPWFLRAEFSRSGPDLKLIGPDGQELLIQDYFNQSPPPDLTTADGVVLHGAIATRLAGPIAPGQYAQAAPGTASEPIGRVETIAGEAKATRADGSQATLTQGDPVFAGDILETSADGSVGIVFADESTFSLGEDGRMTLDEMIYDPGSQEGSMSVNLLQGAFTFVSGQIAKTDVDAMKITTPTSTIGIRGTAGVGDVDENGATNAGLLPEANGFTGEMSIGNENGFQTINQALQVVNIANANSGPSTPFTMTPQQMGQAFGSAMSALPNAGNSIAGNVVSGANQGRAEQQAAEQAADEAAANQAEAEGKTEEAQQAEAEAQAAAEAAAAEAEAAALAAEAPNATPEDIAAAAEAAAAAEEAQLAVAQAAAEVAAAEAELAAAAAEVAQAELAVLETSSIGAVAAAAVDAGVDVPGADSITDAREAVESAQAAAIEAEAEAAAVEAEAAAAEAEAAAVEAEVEAAAAEAEAAAAEADAAAAEAEAAAAEAEAIAQAEAQFQAEVEANLQAQFEADIQAQIEADIQAQIEADIQAQIDAEIQAQIDAEIQAGIDAALNANDDNNNQDDTTSTFSRVVDSTTGNDTLLDDETSTQFRMIQGSTLGGLDDIDGGAGTDELFLDNLYDFEGVYDIGANILTYTAESDSVNGEIILTGVEQLWANDGAEDDVRLNITGGASDEFGYILAGGTGNDTLSAAAGESFSFSVGTLPSHSITAAKTAGTIMFGASGNDHITGSDGEDMLFGGADTDTLLGGAGSDSLFGGAGNDQLTGGAGSDALDGGAGTNTFIYTSASQSNTSNADVIYNFADGTDIIKFDSIAGISLNTTAYTFNSDITQTITDIVTDGGIANQAVFFTDGLDGYLYIKGSGSGTDYDTSLIQLAGVTTVISSSSLTGIDDAGVQNVSGTDSVALTASLDDVIIGSGNDDYITLTGAAEAGDSFDGAGHDAGGIDDVLQLANATNVISVLNVETVGGGSGTDTVTLTDSGGATTEFFNVETIIGGSGNDSVSFVSTPASSIDLGGGSGDQLTLFNSATNYSYAVSNTETITGGTGNDTITLNTALTSGTITGGAANDSLQMASGGNSITISEMETIIGGSGDDVITLASDADLVTSLDLGGGTADNLTLGNYNQALTVSNTEIITGGTQNDDITLGTVLNESGALIDLGAFTDTLTLANGANTLTVKDAETIIGGTGAETLTVTGSSAGTITLGNGGDVVDISGTSGVQTVVFANDVNDFGDIINGFTVGASGDIIDYNATVSRGSGLGFETLATGGTVGTNTAVVSYTTDIAGYQTLGTVATALNTLVGLGANNNMLFAVGDGTDSKLYRWVDTGNGTVESGELTNVTQMNSVNNDNLIADNFSGFSVPSVSNSMTFGSTVQYATTTSGVSLDSFTFEAWVKVASSATTRGILGGRASATEAYELTLTTGGYLQLFMTDDTPLGGTANVAVTLTGSTTKVDNGQWHHVAATYDSTTGATVIYVDGNVEASATEELNFNTGSTVTIGNGLSTVQANPLLGEMADARIWSTARTASEIATYDDQRLTGNETGLEVYYKFNSGSDTTDTASGNTLVKNGTPTLNTGQGPNLFGTDPLVFDLDGDGIELISADQGVQFDLDGDGTGENIGWFGADDGMLVSDVNQNGQIDDMSEVVSPNFQYNSVNTSAAGDSLDALAMFDDNDDGEINSSDQIFGDLRIWKDANTDGITDIDELLTLQEANISSISLSAEVVNQDVGGNTVWKSGTYTTNDGGSGEFADLSFELAAEPEPEQTPTTDIVAA